MGQQFVLSEGIFWFSLLLYAVSYIIHKSILLCIVSPMRVPQIWLNCTICLQNPQALYQVLPTLVCLGIQIMYSKSLGILKNQQSLEKSVGIWKGDRQYDRSYSHLKSLKMIRWSRITHNRTYVGPLYMHISQKLLKISPWNFVCFLRCIDVHFLQISSHSGVVKLEPVVDLSRNDQITPFRSYTFLLHLYCTIISWVKYSLLHCIWYSDTVKSLCYNFML